MGHSSWAAALSLSLATALLPSLARAQGSLSLTLAPKRADASTVSAELDPAFAGFGIEPSNLYSFTGGDVPNAFSLRLLQNLADYAGTPPHIRIGGNTQDYMTWNQTMTEMTVRRNPNSVAQGAIAADSMIIGPGYFQAIERFPKGTWITYGLNLAYQAADWQTMMTQQAKAAVDGLKNTQLYSFEIGNEPDLYLQNGMRTGVWDGPTYSKEFLQRADVVYKQVLQPAKLPATFFEGPCTASTIGNSFEIATLVDNGFLGEVDGNLYVGWWNQHDYFQFIGVTTEAITLDNLMNLDSTETQFKYWAKQVKIGLSTGVPYVLREMSSVGPIGMHGVSDTFGAALWTLNFFCYTATLNVSSVEMHMTDNSNASAWQPIEVYGQKPFVRPQYYAHAAMAQLVGNGNGTTQIGVLSDAANFGGSYKGRLRAYSVYANGNIQSAVLINSKPAPASQANKASFSFTLDFGATNKNKEVFLSYLTADGSDSLSGTSWNGMTYDDVTGVQNNATQVFVLNTDDTGKVSVPVRDSQAVIANLDWLLGANIPEKVDPTSTSGSRRKSSAATQLTGVQHAAFSLVALLIAFFCFA